MGMLEAMGCEFVTEPAQADIIVLNTCAIRDHAEKRVYGNLGALTHTKKANPEQIICLCGCMAQQEKNVEKIKKIYSDNLYVDEYYIPREYMDSKQEEYDRELNDTEDVYEIKEVVDNILNLYRKEDSIKLISIN